MAHRAARDESSSLGQARVGMELWSVARHETIAVVDDDVSMRASLRALLRSVGFRVEAFASAEEFLKSGPASRFSCGVLDVRMSGMSGLDLQDHLRDGGSMLPIVFMTAHADPSIKARALANGAADFLQKPFTDEALLEAIEAAMHPARP